MTVISKSYKNIDMKDFSNLVSGQEKLYQIRRHREKKKTQKLYGL